MGHSAHDPATKGRPAWNAGRKLGATRPQTSAGLGHPFWLDRERRTRDRAMFDLAIDSKLRGCDIVKLMIGDLISGGRVRSRAIVIQRKTSGRSSSSCSNLHEQHSDMAGSHGWYARRDYAFRVGSTRHAHQYPQYAP